MSLLVMSVTSFYDPSKLNSVNEQINAACLAGTLPSLGLAGTPAVRNPMLSGRFTHATIRILDWIAGRTLPPDNLAEHLRTGRRGEEDAYFYLRRHGYTMAARNFRSPNRRGEIDLIGWYEGTLCFVEVKTRTTHDVKPAEAAVDREKRYDLLAVAREYLRHMPPSCPWRLEVVSVYYDQPSGQPQIEVFRNVPS
jgi:putative endonuclease